MGQQETLWLMSEVQKDVEDVSTGIGNFNKSDT
jgi:hypothetical protein